MTKFVVKCYGHCFQRKKIIKKKKILVQLLIFFKKNIVDISPHEFWLI